METDRKLALAFLPAIQKDRNEPFPVRFLGYTVFRERGLSGSFADLTLDPGEYGAACIIEYAVFYDYDIQHLYDLEHIWVAVRVDETVVGCWSSFHGMRLRDDRLPAFRAEGTHPVLYAQPGKHALLPDPALFLLRQDFPECCNAKAGGGLLIPPFLRDQLQTDAEQDERLRRHIRTKYAFEPAMEYVPEEIREEQVIPWPELLTKIPERVRAQLAILSDA